MKTNLILFLALLMMSASSLQGQENISNVVTFAKAYGYVKYFHPSNEAAQMDWNKFSVYGAEEVSKCKNQEELINTLNRIFNPIGPSIKFSSTQEQYDFSKITPKDLTEYKPTYWQHLGVTIGQNAQNVYKSIRVNQLVETAYEGELRTIMTESIFDVHPNFGEIISKEIGNGIFCQIPLIVYSNSKSTYPISNSLGNLTDHLSETNESPNDLYVRLGNVINTYNVFQHFYPYFDVVDVDWDKEFMTALKRSYVDQTEKDHLITLQKFTAPLKDGHIFILDGKREWYAPPITWEWPEDQLVITEVLDETLDIQVGDVVTKVNDLPAKAYFKEINSRISAGTEGYLKYIAKRSSQFGKKDTKLKIEINNKTLDLRRAKDSYAKIGIEIMNHAYKHLANGNIYLNLSKIEMDTITKLLPMLEQASGIICDGRGYIQSKSDFISHLMSKKDTSVAWLKIPQIIYPDQENISSYQGYEWNLEPKSPYLGDKKIVFIINGRAVSSSESFMSFIEHYNLGTIVGQPTAGTNGAASTFNLLGNISVRWTGTKVVKHDGSQHHGIGILPDIYVERTYSWH